MPLAESTMSEEQHVGRLFIGRELSIKGHNQIFITGLRPVGLALANVGSSKSNKSFQLGTLCSVNA
jgi:hypothetical protein